MQMPLSPKAMVDSSRRRGVVAAGRTWITRWLASWATRSSPPSSCNLAIAYLDVNYRPSSTFIYDGATSGILLGATFNLK